MEQVWSFALGVLIMLAIRFAPKLDAPLPSPVIDLREELAQAPLGPRHRSMAAVVAVAVFFAGYDLFDAAFAVPYVTSRWQLAPAQAALLVSSGLGGFAAAALVQGKAADRLGRRAALLLGLWMMTIGSYGTGQWADSFRSFFGWRFLTGFGAGVMLPASVTYLTEIAPRRARTMFAALAWAPAFCLGGASAWAAGAFLAPVFSWRILYFVASGSWLLVIACHLLQAESPAFLLIRRRVAEAIEIVARLHPSRARRYFEPGARFVLSEPGRRPGSVTLLFSAGYRRTTLAVSASAFFALLAASGLVAWVPGAMSARGQALWPPVALWPIVLGVALGGTLACCFVIDRLGTRRAAIAVWWLLGGSALGGLAFANGHLVSVVAMTVAVFGVLGGLGALTNVTASLYETEVRSTAVGIMLGIGSLGLILGPSVIKGLQQHVRGEPAIMVALGVAALLGAISIACVPAPAALQPAVRE